MPLTDAEVLANLPEAEQALMIIAKGLARAASDMIRRAGESMLSLCRSLAETRIALAVMVALAEHYTDPGITTSETYARIDKATRQLKGEDDGT